MPSVAGKQDQLKSGMDLPENFKNLQVYLEKKIRNLEKKKNRLDEYQKRRDSGETLTSQQEEALSSVSVTVTSLEITREFLQQVLEQAKHAKKAEKRQKIEREKQTAEFIKKLLAVQSILDEMGSEGTKQLFSDENSTSGLTLKKEHFEILDDLYRAITPRREEQSDQEVASWDSRLQQSAENCLNLFEARERQLNSLADYKRASELIDELSRLPYFTSATIPKRPEPVDNDEYNDDSNELEDENEVPATETDQNAVPSIEEYDYNQINANDVQAPITSQPEIQQQQQQQQQQEEQEQLQQQCTLNDLRQQLNGQFDFGFEPEVDTTQSKQPTWNSNGQANVNSDWSNDHVQPSETNQVDRGQSWNKQASWKSTGRPDEPAGDMHTSEFPTDGKQNEGDSADVFSSATQSDYLKSMEQQGNEGASAEFSRGGRGAGGRGGPRGGGNRGARNYNRGRPQRGAMGGADMRGGGGGGMYRGGGGRFRGNDEGYSNRAGRGSSYNRGRAASNNVRNSVQ